MIAPRERSDEAAEGPTEGERERAGPGRALADAPRSRESHTCLRPGPRPLPFPALSSFDEGSAANLPWPSDKAEAQEPVDERFNL